jgi:predicted nucleotidyltransferase
LTQSVHTMAPVNRQARYPTPEHGRAAEAVTAFFSEHGDVEAVLLTCSCARGKATPDSCVDIVVLVSPETLAAKRPALEREWREFYPHQEVFQKMLRVGAYSHVDLEFHDGRFEPPEHGWTTGADEFELAVGNIAAYSVPLWERSDYYRRLREKWLPYYDEELRRSRLQMVHRYCLNNLHHIPVYVRRGLYFQAFARLYHAFGEFLQALFMARRIYPIAYDKWIKEQIEDILELPQLYRELPNLFEIGRFESGELGEKGTRLEGLLSEYIADV